VGSPWSLILRCSMQLYHRYDEELSIFVTSIVYIDPSFSVLCVILSLNGMAWTMVGPDRMV
jgi:hypothetical protein